MKFSRILAIVLSLLFSYQSVNTTLNNVSLSGVVEQETVTFTITNNGASTLVLDYYIVTQDNILERVEGETTLSPGQTTIIPVAKPTPGVHVYTLTVTEKLIANEHGDTKMFTVEG